ncbi:hypothetical protein B0H16DRAFT_1700727 [Mycena metata]|uniref:Uncharacterized protein n=1 Tax=Mycena metata TaxID=1033252 RepID=A0AAD7MHY6_9AGAR|nr:hypothetical protein B0H16DRAFT_1700727 [Mycena metata]
MLALRRMPFRPQISPIIYSINATVATDSLSTVSTVPQASTSDQPADKKKTRWKRERFAEPYRADIDLDVFSCSWEKWNSSYFIDIRPSWHDLSLMEFFVKRVAKVPGTIRPLAFVPNVPDPLVVFEAAGKYYYLNTAADYLERFGGGWESHDVFLAAFTRKPSIKGAVHEFLTIPRTFLELCAWSKKGWRQRLRRLRRIQPDSWEPLA